MKINKPDILLKKLLKYQLKDLKENKKNNFKLKIPSK